MNRHIPLLYSTIVAVRASPIPNLPGTQPSDPHNGPLSYLIAAILILSGSCVTLLLVAKWIYLSRRYRQTGYVSRTRKAGLSARPRWNNNFSVPNKQHTFGILPCELPNRDERGKSGLLVGLFGSPSWETRYSNIIDAVSEQLSSRIQRGSATSPNPQHHLSHHYTTEANEYADNISADTKRTRDLSERQLPKLSSAFRLSWELPAPPLALVPKSTLDNPLDLSSHSGICAVPSSPTINSYPRDQPFIGLPKAALLSHPSSVDSWNVSLMHTNDRNSREPFLRQSFICSPMAMAPESGHRAVDDTTPKPDYYIPNPPPYDTSSLLQLISCSSQDPFKPRDSQLHIVIPDESIFRDTPDNTLFGAPRHLSDMGEAIDTCVKSPAVAQVTRIRSRTSPPLHHAQKRSPKIGPSPLRTMFVPENEGNDYWGHYTAKTDLSSRSSLNSNDIPHTYKPEEYKPVAKALTTRYAREYNTKKNSRTTRNQSNDSENLFGLIQELAYETKAWDDSLFVDHKFKAMIDGSNQAIGAYLTPRTRRSRICRPLQHLCTHLEDIPEVEGATFVSPSIDLIGEQILAAETILGEIPLESRQDIGLFDQECL